MHPNFTLSSPISSQSTPLPAHLANAHVFIMGVGGLGSAVAFYLAAAGVTKLTLVDFDTVENSNLQRQIVHSIAHLRCLKVDSAQKTLQARYPNLEITVFKQQLGEGELRQAIQACDVVVDCCDNFTTRFQLNAACVQMAKPLVSGAAIRFAGQVAVFSPPYTQHACYRCLYPDMTEEAETCTNTGILAPLVGIIGSIQALETVKLLTHYGQTLTSRLLILNALSGRWRTTTLLKDRHCRVCGNPPF